MEDVMTIVLVLGLLLIVWVVADSDDGEGW